MLRDVSTGGYRFLPGISAFSSGVVATSGWEIVHATLAAPVPWRDGFARIDRHLREAGRPRAALCGIELRSPAPFTFGGFDEFNEGYRSLLAEWKRADATYTQRVANLRTGGGLTGGVRLTAATVLDDGYRDLLRGGAGADWFWSRLAPGVVDALQDREANEAVN